MKTPEELLEDQLRVMRGCNDFLATHVPGWAIDAMDPVEALEDGVASCASKSAIAITYLGLHGVHADFAFQTAHGEETEPDVISIGHALALANTAMPFMTLGIDSYDDGRTVTRHISDERLKGYHVNSLKYGYPEYCYLARRSVSLDGLTHAVMGRMQTRAEYGLLTRV